MSNRCPRFLFLGLATAIVAAAAPTRADSDGWRSLPADARMAISRSIAADQVRAGRGLSPQTVDTIFQEAKLGSTEPGSLGTSVAMSGDVVVAGAPFATPAAAYIFVKPADGWADTTSFTAKLTSSDGVEGDNFGNAVAISGNTVVVGAPQLDIFSAGAAYVYVEPQSGWKSTSAFAAKLTASFGVNGDAFGGAVAISEGTIFVGADGFKVGANVGQGAVYVFKEPGAGWASTSSFAARLTISGGQADDQFGASLAVLGNTLVSGSAGGAEAAYVFVEPASGWASTGAFDAKLTVPDSFGNIGFGLSVALSEDTIVVGAPYARVGSNSEQGAAFVYEMPASGWATTSAFDAELTASDGTSANYFGNSVAVSGPTIAVGRPLNAGSENFPGAAYVFVKPASGWATTDAFDAKLEASDAAGADAFGGSIAISNGTLAVGALVADHDNGAVYLFGPLPEEGCDQPGRLCVTPVTPPSVGPVHPRP